MDAIVDSYVWWFLQLYFLPFRLPGIMGETDKWISSVSMNGIKAANLCKPN